MNPRRLALAIALVALAACPANNTPPPSPPSPAPSAGYEPPAGEPATAAPAGAACTAATDCASGVCEGEGCGDTKGVCAASNRACTKDLRQYCGCDGVTFGASGSCPGQRFAHAGACPAATPPPPPPGCPGGAGCPAQADGAPCLVATDCASGTCEGLGCGAGAPGVCMPRARRCTRDRRAYCGCEGTTFYASGSCPGRRHSAREACPNG